jgi:hypothetical protein
MKGLGNAIGNDDSSTWLRSKDFLSNGPRGRSELRWLRGGGFAGIGARSPSRQLAPTAAQAAWFDYRSGRRAPRRRGASGRCACSRRSSRRCSSWCLSTPGSLVLACKGCHCRWRRDRLRHGRKRCRLGRRATGCRLLLVLYRREPHAGFLGRFSAVAHAWSWRHDVGENRYGAKRSAIGR